MSLRALYDVPAPAKLNLFLHVIGRRADGYHLLQSLMVPIDWCDTLHFERRDDGRLARHDLGDPLPDDDLCLRAARALQTASRTALGADISVMKTLPTGAGLGGGSSDAATTLLTLNRLWGLDWPRSRLSEIGLGIGADVPFFLGRGPALVEGIGERVTPLKVPPAGFAVLKPVTGIETRAVFQSPSLVRNTAPLVGADILAGYPNGEDSAEVGGLVQLMRLPHSTSNDLQAVAESMSSDVGRARTLLDEAFGNSRMTGSGSAVFAATAPAVDGQVPERSFEVPTGWVGRMCRSLSTHPLADWSED